MEDFKKLVSLLSSEFDKYIMEHPEIEDKIPQNAIIIFQIDGEEKFNEWHRDISLRNCESGQPVIYAKIEDFRIKSLLEKSVLEEVLV